MKLGFLGEPEKGAWMDRDFEKDIIELDAAIKSNAERDNTFTLSVLQRAKEIILQQKEKLKAYEDIGLEPGEIEELKARGEVQKMFKPNPNIYCCPACGEKIAPMWGY